MAGIPRAVVLALARCCFDPRYLTGRHFGPYGDWWRWVLRGILWQKVFGINRHVPWPVVPSATITDPARLEFDPDDLQNFQSPGVYWNNGLARIVVGRGTAIGPNVGLITANHDPADPDRHLPGEAIVLGEHCWIGMNATILPGVTLGPYTTVGAGAVVTKSFPGGHCVIAGNPARVIRDLPTSEGRGP